MGGGFLWFGMGALAAWTLSHHREREARYGQLDGYGERQRDFRHWGPNRGPWGSAHDRRVGPVGPHTTPPTPHFDEVPSPSMQQQQPPVGPGFPMTQQHWEELQHLRRQAGERVTEMSESTIDSLVAGLQSLKSRIAEHRAQQERTALGMAQQGGPALQTVSPPSPQPGEQSRLV
ncbi:hypothetical protein K488DRAFT_67238 [Vararia minispora EC-137]|uniref:Uncharacterized protein n=1 Tax=Vararia minispora EC-137 TaxID=1314806 RepID=A0ACB8QYY4_9AGAM|nr:hypothetical protein K488DRAFT_67238 [Vararia minispora EC-137]